jgi:HK97 family phage major capsid protein
MKDVIQTINDLKQKRMKVVADQKALLAKAQDEKRSISDWTPDERSAYDKAEEDFKKYDSEIRTLEEFSKKQERLALEQSEQRTPEANAPEAPDAKKAYRAAFMKWVTHGTQSMTPEERKVLRTGFHADPAPGIGETRAQTITTTGGGYLIPTDLASELERIMLYYGPMMDPSVTGEWRTDSGNPKTWPVLNDTSNTGRLLNINTQTTETAMVFSQLNFDAYKFSSDHILVPYELLEDSDFNMDLMINDTLTERLGRVINTYLTTGTGSSQPNGIVTASANGKTAAAQTAITRDEIIDLIHSVDRSYRNGPKVGFMMHDLIMAVLKKMTIGSGDDRPLWQPSIREGEPDKLEGYPYWINNDMSSSLTAASKPILFGNFGKYIVRKVNDFRLYRLDERYRDYDQSGFIGFFRVDGELKTNSAVKRITMAA